MTGDPRIVHVRPTLTGCVQLDVTDQDGQIQVIEMTASESRRWALKILLAGHGEEMPS